MREEVGRIGVRKWMLQVQNIGCSVKTAGKKLAMG